VEENALYLKGARRTGARERQEHGLCTTEGKDPMSFKACVYLARLLAKSNDPEHVMLHLFLILDWQVVSRAEGVVDQHMDLSGVYEDALLVHMGPSKGDQDGTKHADHPGHLYSVLEEPAICPCLAFIKFLLNNPLVLNGKCKDFDGASQYE
jgi:hypothetical protein